MGRTGKSKKRTAEAVVKDIKRKTRRKFSCEEKIRIVLEGLKGEESISEICRKEVKVAMHVVLFTDNRYMGNNQYGSNDLGLKQFFKEVYPNVYEVFKIIKSKKKEVLPILLQAIEAELVLNRIVPRITKERPYLPIFTLHDSVVTTQGNEEYIKQIILEESKKMLGFEPKLKKEDWD